MNKAIKMFMAAAIVMLGRGGVANPVEYIGKKAYKLGFNDVSNVKWLTKDRIAVEEHIDYRIDWKILERVNDGQSMMSRIAGYYVSNKRK